MGRIEFLKVEGKTLRDNSLGDPAERTLAVYIPNESQSEPLPCIYALASYPSSGYSMLYRKPFSESFEERVERLVRQGVLPLCYVVFPDCSTRLGGSQYLNSQATGRYQDYLCEEIVELVDSRFRTKPLAKYRAVMGHSSGGFGALSVALNRPDMFGIAACLAGDMGFEFCYLPDFPAAMMSFERAGGVPSFLEKFFKKIKKRQDDFNAINVLAMASVYSPQPNSSLGFELPFDLKTCSLNEEVWRRWLSFDPVRRAQTDPSQFKKFRLFFDCGIFDEYRLFAGARALHACLEHGGVEHRYEEFEDNHRDTAYRFEQALRFIGEYFLL